MLTLKTAGTNRTEHTRPQSLTNDPLVEPLGCSARMTPGPKLLASSAGALRSSCFYYARIAWTMRRWRSTLLHNPIPLSPSGDSFLGVSHERQA